MCERERRGLCGSDPSLLSKVQPNWWLVGTREEMNVVWERGGRRQLMVLVEIPNTSFPHTPAAVAVNTW